MVKPWRVNRRSLLLLMTTWLLDRSVVQSVAREASSNRDATGMNSLRARRFVVNATVILGSLPIFTKRKVGGALLMLEQTGSEECGSVGLQFGAGSSPQYLRGLNRFGVTQETVRTEHGKVAEAAYMSFMTSSRET